MKYTIHYIRKNDKKVKSIIAENAKERNVLIKELLKKDELLHVSYSQLFADGKNGDTKIIKDKKLYFCVADIHSFYDVLISALKKAGFHKTNPNHVFVSCGDLMDRGPDAKKCLDYVNSLPNKILIKGNHEDLLEDILFKKKYFDYYDFHNGTVDTISQISGIKYSDMDTFLQYVMIEDCKNDDALKTYLDSVIDYAEIGNYIIVHGWIPRRHKDYEKEWDNDWRNGDWDEARWLNGMHLWKLGYIIDGKTIICGHWSTSWGHEKFHQMTSNDSFIEPGIVALDATTVLSDKINVYTFEA